jgi:hypothetical protein
MRAPMKRLPLLCALVATTLVGQPVALAHSAPLGVHLAQDEPTLYLDVGNPSPGDTIHTGAFWIEGIAFDSASDDGPGIDHLDIFVDDRDAGGTLIGRAVQGAAALQPEDPTLAGSGWTAEVSIPKKLVGPHSLFIYALSAVSGDEITVEIPVQVVR